MSQDASMITSSPTSSIAKHTLVCSKCNLPLGDQLVRALDNAFHPECFTCWDCNIPVASRYLPHPTEPGQPLCEKDYFKRLGLVCSDCEEPLRGTYIIALDKKFHTNHFTCSECSTVFGANDSYYEHDSQVYCHFHYSTRFAVSCAGCDMAILKQYVEIERNDTIEHWHPECYMIQKFWNVKVAHPMFKDNDPVIVAPQLRANSPIELQKIQKDMEEKILSIWSVLSAFEESSAVCISDMLLHVSNGAYLESICLSERFLVHVESLFAGIDKINLAYQEYQQPEFKYTREAKMLCKKIINFFSLLSRTGDIESKKLGSTQELLSLVTGLAHYLKILIRLALTSALRLEILVGKPVVISKLLAKLMEIPGKERHSRDCQRLIKPKNTDYCQLCRATIEDQCMRYGDIRFHVQCFKCSTCHRAFATQESVVLNSASSTVHCVHCSGVSQNYAVTFEYVTKLSQYSFLLRIALSRLCNLMQITDAELATVDYSSNVKGATSNNINAQASSPSSVERPFALVNNEPNYPVEILDARHTVKLDRKMSRSFKTANKRSTILGNASDGSVHRPRTDSLRPEKHKSIGLNDLPTIAASVTQQQQKKLSQLPQHIHITTNAAGKPRVYLSELSALQYMIIRYVAVVQIEKYVKSSFSSMELLNLIETKKANSIWNKFFNISLKGKKTQHPIKKEDGTFGVPLELLTERTGVESNLGAGHSPVKLAAFVDDAITAMRQMDMTVEGIFRKNGNIRRLKELTDALDRNPMDVDLYQENAVQVAALLKKFLRDLPDPLLTLKLHPLFMCVEKIENPVERKRALHLACCMLPGCNRATMEVLFVFLRWVASFSHVTSDVGSRMDIPNLARVIAPNILTTNSKDPLKDDSFASIRTVEYLLESYDEFALVPEDMEVFLEDPTLSEVDISPKEFLKKVENKVRHKNLPGLNTSKSSMYSHTVNSSSKYSEGPKLYDVTDGKHHPPTSIYAQQQYLPYTNNHPNSDFVPQQMNLRYHHQQVPKRMDSHESFNNYVDTQQKTYYQNYQPSSPLNSSNSPTTTVGSSPHPLTPPQ